MKPKFIPKLGQIDYTDIKRAPVINCVVRYNDKILLVKRSKDLSFYPNCWNGVSGFLDDDKDIKEKAEEELQEELGIEKDNIIRIMEGVVFEQEAPEYNKTWVVHPILVDIKTDKIQLDWEAEDFKWLTLGDVGNLHLLPGFDMVVAAFFPDSKIPNSRF